jgi:hypothetical protein
VDLILTFYGPLVDSRGNVAVYYELVPSYIKAWARGGQSIRTVDVSMQGVGRLI